MAAGKRRYRKFQIPAYLKEALGVLAPREEITVSEWAGRYRILTNQSSHISGTWNNRYTPYLVGIMDAYNQYEIEEIIFCKPTQVGATETILNILGYIIDQNPADTMVVYPTKDLARRTSTKRIEPAVRESPPLIRKYNPEKSTFNELFFGDMTIYLVWSNSPAALSSTPLPNLLIDEVDKFPGASKTEADPVSLARERTKTFPNRKIFITSSPSTKTGHIWRAMEGADEIRHYFVPCPHCGQFIELKFAQLKFPGEESMSYQDRAELAVYVCQECGGIITDRHKPAMLVNGEWRAIEKHAKIARRVAFWINTLYSPFVRFSTMALEFLRSKDDPETLQNFVNGWLAEPWEDTKLKTNADLVLERQTELPEFIVPEWARMLTAGIDVQETSVYYVIRAWGNYLTSQNIAHGQVANFAEIEKVMNLAYQKQSGEQFVVSLALMDSGDQTDSVYDFCANNIDWCYPSKGSSKDMDTHFRLSKVNVAASRAYGAPLVLVNTGKYKDMIAGRMRKENGTGSWMVYQGCDRDFAEQVTSEHKVTVREGSKATQRWVLKTSHADNHYLDCEVYAMCAADMLGARTMHLQQVEPPRKQEPPPAQAYAPENTWLNGGGDGWLGGGENWSLH